MQFPHFALFLLINEIVTQELTLCPLPKINSKCVLKCKTPELKKNVSFIGQGNWLGSCRVYLNSRVCQTFNENFLISENESASETYFTIKSLDKNENEGYWYCQYGTNKSEIKNLLLYDMTWNNTAPVSNPVVNETEDFIRIHFQTDCLSPEPTTYLKCQNGGHSCKVTTFEIQKCKNPSLKIYDVTCNATAECFHENKSKVEIKVNGYSIDEKIVIYKTEQDQITEFNNTSSHDENCIVLPTVISLLVIIIVAAVVVFTIKYRHIIWEIVCKCGKKDKHRPIPIDLEMGDNGHFEAERSS